MKDKATKVEDNFVKASSSLQYGGMMNPRASDHSDYKILHNMGMDQGSTEKLVTFYEKLDPSSTPPLLTQKRKDRKRKECTQAQEGSGTCKDFYTPGKNDVFMILEIRETCMSIVYPVGFILESC